MTARITTHGKQILLDGHHLADARDEEAAQVIALMMEKSSVTDLHTEDEKQRILRFLA